MKRNSYLAVTVVLILELLLFANTGCKEEKSNSGNTTLAGDKQTEPEQKNVETPQKAIAAVEVKPAVNENTITEGHAFPTLEFTSYSGQQVKIADLKGKVVLVDFWAAWCGPCVRAMPDLIETYKMYHNKGFEIIGISLDRDKSQFENYIKKNSITWQQYYDGLWWDNKIARRFGVGSIPHIVLVDKNGAVHYNTDYDKNKPPLYGLDLRNEISKLL